MENYIPTSYEELINNGDCSYSFTTDSSMDNISSMNYFLDVANVPNEAILLHDGTAVEIGIPNSKRKLYLSSYGLGDFFSHGIDVEIVE